MRRFLIALGFLTRVPVSLRDVAPGEFAAALRCYPLVGLVVGGAVAAAGWLGALIDPWSGALAALALWIAITGALHLDGLADLADGLGAAHGDRARLLAVMADPHVGSFGVVVLGLQLLAKLVLLHTLIARTGAAPIWPLPIWPVPIWLALVLVPFAARIGPIAWARLLPPLTTGLGAAIAGVVRPHDLAGWGLVLAGAGALLPGLLAAPILIAAHAAWLRRKLGGINGDAHGAGIELVETGLLIALAACGGGG